MGPRNSQHVFWIYKLTPFTKLKDVKFIHSGSSQFFPIVIHTVRLCARWVHGIMLSYLLQIFRQVIDTRSSRYLSIKDALKIHFEVFGGEQQDQHCFTWDSGEGKAWWTVTRQRKNPGILQSIHSMLQMRFGTKLSRAAGNMGMRTEEAPVSWDWSRQSTGMDWLIFNLRNWFRLIEWGCGRAEGQCDRVSRSDEGMRPRWFFPSAFSQQGDHGFWFWNSDVKII